MFLFALILTRFGYININTFEYLKYREINKLNFRAFKYSKFF